VHTSFNNDCGFAASFEADVLSGPLPLAVQFTDRSTDNSDAWLWDFGDGNSSDQQSPSHTYTTVGKYTVSLTISDGITSDTEVKSELIEVLKGNQSITFEALDLINHLRGMQTIRGCRFPEGYRFLRAGCQLHKF
jgi:PKD repeat protein